MQPAVAAPPSPPQPAAVPSTDLLGLDSAPAPAAPTVQSIFESPTTVPGGVDMGFGAPAPAVNNVGGGGGGNDFLVDVFGAPPATSAMANNVSSPDALSAGAEENFRK